MKLPVEKIIFYAAAAGTVAGIVLEQRGAWDGGYALASVCGIVCIKFGGALRKEKLADFQRIRLGSEDLPPVKDIALIRICSQPLAEEKRLPLLRALAKAKRATHVSGIAKEIPFTIVDHWGGEWELQALAYRDGSKGFSMKRVCYAGTEAAAVAGLIGLE